MSSGFRAGKSTYGALFMVTLAALMYEILLTRIFSVTMWYHYAFVAISVAMFGATVGAILVYLFPRYFTQERARVHLALSSFLFAVSIIMSFLVHANVPCVTHKSSLIAFSIVLTYAILSVPFVFSGICVCLALTKFPGQVSRLYAADLAGAAAGCVLLIYTLEITDGPTAVIVVALLANTGAVFFAAESSHKRLTGAYLISALLLASFVAVHTVLVNNQTPLLRLVWVKGRREPPPLYVKWNSFSRIRVLGDPTKARRPFGWGLSPVYPSNREVRRLALDIDAGAGTIITRFDGDLNDVEHLKYDVVNLAHHVRRDSSVLVVGTGGGRDILAALAFGQKSVVGVEINKDIVDAVNKRFGDFSGHLDRNPKVAFVIDEARSYLTRSADKFDIIQVSLIDTWAATAAGAFVLTESPLYTVEAWRVFLEHLSANGILTFSRWYFRDRPGEVYRLTSLASTSLMELGVKNPRNHIIIVRCRPGRNRPGPDGIGTILVSTQPFSEDDLNAVEEISTRMQFDVVISPRFSSPDSTFAALTQGEHLGTFANAFPLNIAAPTDDSPFFFHMLRFKDMFDRGLWRQGYVSFNMKAVFILGCLLATVVGLTLLCIIVPLVLTTKKGALRGSLPLFVFFACIGFGFMLVEISQMQRLIIFLGHPTYGLTVVLFALLLSSGLGSFSTHRVGSSGLARSAAHRLLLLLCVLAVFGSLTPHAVRACAGARTPVRICVATVLLLPLGLCMGMAFPLGMKAAAARSGPIITPWLWGINGATSVCGSVLALVIAMSWGISTSFWTGFSSYVLAVLAFFWAGRLRVQ